MDSGGHGHCVHDTVLGQTLKGPLETLGLRMKHGPCSSSLPFLAGPAARRSVSALSDPTGAGESPGGMCTDPGSQTGSQQPLGPVGQSGLDMSGGGRVTGADLHLIPHSTFHYL